MRNIRVDTRKGVNEILRNNGWPDTPENRIKALKILKGAHASHPGELPRKAARFPRGYRRFNRR